MILRSDSLLQAATWDINIPQCRVGIDQKTALPGFLGIGPEKSKWIEENMMPANLPAALESEGDCLLESVAREGDARITARWVIGPKAVPVELLYEAKDGKLRVRFSRGKDGHPPVQFALRVPLDPKVTPTTFLCSTKDDQGKFYLPGVLSAPDHGQLQMVPLTVWPAAHWSARRSRHICILRSRLEQGLAGALWQAAPGGP